MIAMNVTWMKLNASKNAIPTANDATEAARPAKSQ